MKKNHFVLLAVLTTILAGCSSSTYRSYQDLPNNKVLTVGGTKLLNYSDVNTTPVNLSYTFSVGYTLSRYLYNPGSGDIVQYNNYYYLWTVSATAEQEELGNKTTSTDYKYAYLVYSENEALSVKTTISTETSYNFNGGWIIKNFDFTTELNGYFASFSALKAAVPELAAKIDVSGTKKYYVDVTTPKTVATSYQQYTTFYYFGDI